MCLAGAILNYKNRVVFADEDKVQRNNVQLSVRYRSGEDHHNSSGLLRQVVREDAAPQTNDVIFEMLRETIISLYVK